MKRSDEPEAKLFVYECSGQGYPKEEPSFEGFMGLWPEPPFYYVFSRREALEPVEQWAREQEGWAIRDTYRLDYAQWQQVSPMRQRVGPFVIGDLPDDGEKGGAPGSLPIGIDPGVVFGSGLHPTTRGCLMTIAELSGRFPVGTAIDLGTGTGILAIACARLGIPRVVALDCNPLAAKVAKRNVVRNGQAGIVHVLAGEGLEVLKTPCDLLVMNLEWPCLKTIVRGREWLGYRWIVLSGFLQSQWSELQSMLPSGVGVDRCRVLDDWMTVLVAGDAPGRGSS